MAFRKIEDGELVGKGNMGQPDTPGVSTSEMQRIMDEIPREIIVPAFNELSDELIAETAAASLGAQVVEGLPEETPATVQGVMEALYSTSKAGESSVSEALKDHAGNTNNPHNVTAAQTGAYTKEETDAAIDAKVVQIGTADMAKSVYDPTRQERDIFSAIDAVQDAAQAAAQAATSRTYTAVLPASGWTGSASAGYTQTVSCEGMTADVVTLPPAIQPTGVRETDIAAREALGYISMVETLGGQVTVTCWESKPETDLTIYLVEAR